MYIYIYAVGFKAGPMFPFYTLKIGPFIFSRITFSLQKEEVSLTPPPKKKTQFYKLTFGPIMLRNMLGPVFNL